MRIQPIPYDELDPELRRRFDEPVLRYDATAARAAATTG